jgi:hypothetical protein
MVSLAQGSDVMSVFEEDGVNAVYRSSLHFLTEI